VDLIRDDQLATLTLGDAMPGAVSWPCKHRLLRRWNARRSAYLVQGPNAQLVLPDDITDEQVAELGGLNHKSGYSN
jgi:hypothetical protein